MKSIDDLYRKLDKILKDPNNPLLFNEIGVLLFQLNDLENAYLYLNRAYELCPANLDILYNYALLLFSQFKWGEAITIYKYYLKLDPGDEEVLDKLRDLYYQLSEYQEAAKYIHNPGKELIYDRK